MPVLGLWDSLCASCGEEIRHHTMQFIYGQPDATHPIRCPIGQWARWVTWDEALGPLNPLRIERVTF